MGNTTIEWTDKTWNPIRGCSRVSEGCRNCYAERQAARFRDVGQPFHQFVRTHVNGLPQWTGKVELIEKHLEDPLHWRKPCRIFVNSMSDLFHEALPFEAIDEVFTTMIAADWHTYQILTKRSGRMLEYFRSGRHDGGIGPDRADYHLDGRIWLGVSAEDQKTADQRIPLLLQTPAAIRFVSYEPALGPIDFAPWLKVEEHPPLDWIIIGAESGPYARPFNEDWARSVRDQCMTANVPLFYKQNAKNGHKISIPELDGRRWIELPGICLTDSIACAIVR